MESLHHVVLVQQLPKGSSRLIIKQKQFVLAATDYKYDSLTSQPITIAWGSQINRVKWDATINPVGFSVIEYEVVLFLALEAKCLNSSCTILMPYYNSYLWDFKLICVIDACLHNMVMKLFAAQRWYSVKVFWWFSALNLLKSWGLRHLRATDSNQSWPLMMLVWAFHIQAWISVKS